MALTPQTLAIPLLTLHVPSFSPVLLGPPFAPHSLPTAALSMDSRTPSRRLRAARCPRVPHRSAGRTAQTLQRGHNQ